MGHLFAVISEGYGSMPSYGEQIPVRDRWAIVGYLRALQASQHFPEAKATEQMRRRQSQRRAGRRGRKDAMSENSTLEQSDLGPGKWYPLWIGIVVLSACVIGAPSSPVQFFRAYLATYLFLWGVGMGSMALLMVYHMTGGSWGLLIRRTLEAGMRTLPLLAIFFVPIACGIGYLYVWAQPEVVAASHKLQYQQFYLSPLLFWIRAAAYFAVWLTMAFFFASWSRRQDATGNPRLAWKSLQLSAYGAVLYGISLHFAAVDWAMSLNPNFHSSIWGPLFAAGQLLSGLAFALVVFACLQHRPPLAELASNKARNDLGSLLFTFLILWAYMAWFQFMLIWIANMQVDVIWYLPRAAVPWQWVIGRDRPTALRGSFLSPADAARQAEQQGRGLDRRSDPFHATDVQLLPGGSRDFYAEVE